jgi:manganese/zinc/iron transport system permease protein
MEWNGTFWGPRAVWILTFVLVLLITFIYFLFQPLKWLCFDEAFALALGLPVIWLHYAVMTLVSLTTVAAFDLVGSILVVAMLVVPPATALLLARGLQSQLWLSALFAVAASLFGYGLAIWLDASISGAMAVCAGLIFIAVFLVRLGRRRFVPGR